MFNLTHSIQRWRRSMRHLPDGRIDELEDHLISEIENLEVSGLTQAERFMVARSRLAEAYPTTVAKAMSALQRRQSAIAYILLFSAVVLTTLAVNGAALEIFREIDDWVALQIGESANDFIKHNLHYLVGIPTVCFLSWLTYFGVRFWARSNEVPAECNHA